MLSTYSTEPLSEKLESQILSAIHTELFKHYNLSNDKIAEILENFEIFTQQEFNSEFYGDKFIDWEMTQDANELDAYNTEEIYIAYYLDGNKQYALYLVKIVDCGVECYGFAAE